MTLLSKPPMPSIRTPASPRMRPAPSGLFASASHPRSPTVLVVQPDRTARTVALLALQRTGYRGVGVARGDEGLFMLLERHFDAILIAADASGIGCADFLSRVRAIPTLRNTPALVLVHPGAAEGATPEADAVLSLPLGSAVLDRTLKATLARRLANRDREAGPGDTLSVGPALGRGLPPLGSAALVIRAWPGAGNEPDPTPSSALPERRVATQLGLQVECIYRHGGHVERLVEGLVFAVFEGPAGVFDAGNCATAILALSSGVTDSSPQRQRVALGLSCCAPRDGNVSTPAEREAVLADAFSEALANCESARPLQIIAPRTLERVLGAHAGVRYVSTPTDTRVSGSRNRVGRSRINHAA